MYEKYNAVLRWHSGDAFLQKRCVELTLGKWVEPAASADKDGADRRWVWWNQYTTSIHSINSIVLKLSKLTRATLVYRGFAGRTLPTSFWERDPANIRGGIEFGFTSTTTERDQAVHYAQGSASTIFVMRQGMVDRGASLRWLSQYPHEREILFAPLLGLEALGARVDGSLLMVEIALSNNLNSLTLEQVESKRRKVCIDMVHSMSLELGEELKAPRWEAPAWLPALQEKATESLACVQHHLANTPSPVFNDDAFLAAAFRGVVGVRNAVSHWPDELAMLCVGPMQQQARQAVENISLAEVIELRFLKRPPAGVDDVFACARLLLASEGDPVDHPRFTSWGQCRVQLFGDRGRMKRFMDQMLHAQMEQAPPFLEQAMPYLTLDHMSIGAMKSKWSAAASIATWCRAYMLCQRMLLWVRHKERQVAAQRETAKGAAQEEEARLEAAMAANSDVEPIAQAARAALQEHELPESELVRQIHASHTDLDSVDDIILRMLGMSGLSAQERTRALRGLRPKRPAQAQARSQCVEIRERDERWR